MGFLNNKLKRAKKGNKRKIQLIKELGYGKIPSSILAKEIVQTDVILNKQNKTYGSNAAIDRNMLFFYNKVKKEHPAMSNKYIEKMVLKNFTQKARNCRHKSSCLSIFPQKLGKLFVKFYSKEGDIVYDPFCVSGETLISLPEGDFPIKTLVGKKDLYVYCSNGKEIKLRKAYNIRKTKTRAKVLKITMTEGKSIVVTPNHLFMTTSGEWVEAKNLKPKQSLMPFYRGISHGRWIVKIKPGKFKRQSKFVFEEVSGFKINDKEFQVHHKDKNRLNDRPSNLEKITPRKHGKIHHPKGVAPYLSTFNSRKNLSRAMTGSKNIFFNKRHSSQSKRKISVSAIGRNVGRKHSDKAKLRMSVRHYNKDYVQKTHQLLLKGNISYKNIARQLGIHKNTVGNIARNKFNYNHRVISIKKLNKPIDVYNMEVEEFENFVANGVIVHNCGHNSRMQLTHSCNRHYIGVDISSDFMKANREIRKRLRKNDYENLIQDNSCSIKLIEGSSAKVELPSKSADFTITSPPYWDIEWYGDEKEQLGKTKTYQEFLDKIYLHIKENYRILKTGSYAVWCVNDFVKKSVYYCYHSDLINLFNKAGFTTHAVYIIDLKTSLGIAFVQTILKTMRFPKQHEYALVFLKR